MAGLHPWVFGVLRSYCGYEPIHDLRLPMQRLRLTRVSLQLTHVAFDGSRQMTRIRYIGGSSAIGMAEAVWLVVIYSVPGMAKRASAIFNTGPLGKV